jgi:myo-inositol 2-dehydrogenase/D-chiro-inositol 1-dehydrogenase
VNRRVGIVGAGNMARVHADAWNAIGADVTMVLGHSETKASVFASNLGAIVASSMEELADSVDVVDICSPTDTHLSYITEAARAGTAVVCENPLARNGMDARLAVTACAEAGVILLPAHVLRFFSEYRTAKDRVDAGDLGEIAVVRLNRSTYLPRGESGWFNDTVRSGGVVYDLMIHDVDYAAWIAGPVLRMYARLGSNGHGGDHVLATLRHANGAISHLQGSWAFPVGTFNASLEIAGSNGLIGELPGDETEVGFAVENGNAAGPEPSASGESPYIAQLRHFAAVLDGDENPIVTGTEAADAVAVCDAIAASIESGRAVSVEDGR